MNAQFTRALSPVRRRMRLARAAAWGAWGLAAGMCAGALLAAAAFLWPMAYLVPGLIALPAAAALAGALLGALWPVPLIAAARAADAAGLKERAQTALALQGDGSDMARLQREDALGCLDALDARAALPLRVSRTPLRAALGCALAAALLLALPNPQDAVLLARQETREELARQAERIAQAAEALDTKELTQEELRELRKLTGELASDMREASDTREALEAIDEKQRQLERLQQQVTDRIAEATREALAAQQSLAPLAQAMESGDQAALDAALQDLLAQMSDNTTAKAVADALAAAAQDAPAGAVQDALAKSAGQCAAGNAAQAAQSVGDALQSAGLTGADIAALVKMARAGAAQAGQGQGAGQGQTEGSGAGSGAGKGSTQQDAGYGEGAQAAQEGAGGITDKVGQYERIYDPTRLGGDSEASLDSGEPGEGASQQLELGAGRGELTGSVPYAQVIGEYREAAAQSVSRGELSETLSGVVTRYFDALID